MSRSLLAIIFLLLPLPLLAQEKSVNPGINKPFEAPDVPEFVERFEREGRDAFDHRKEVVAALELKPGMAVADVGAGTGLFTRMFSPLVGEKGKVYAVDISDKFVAHVERIAKDQKQNNIVGVVCKPDSVELPPASVDLVFICDTYHHFEFPHKTMRSINKALKPGGQVVLIDFHRIEGVSSEWALNHVRAGQEVFTKEIEEAGFKQVNEKKGLLKESYYVWFEKVDDSQKNAQWNQWRGSTRDGLIPGDNWADSLKEDVLVQQWRIELPPSYSGPIVSESMVFTTGTAEKKTEVVYGLDRKTGKEIWKAEWPSAMSVPFFAASNGSWIRATPAFDGESLFVAGMRDVLVSLNAKTGAVQWRVDFVEELKTPLPAFGFASSPLLDGDFLYVQAGASFIKLDKKTGKTVWSALKDEGGMMGSAFSSPIITKLAGRRQAVVQTRQNLAGVDPESGGVLWEQKVPSFRGMNILTPIPFKDGIFTSSYQNKSWLYRVSTSEEKFASAEAWENNAQGYMSTPVVIDGHAYLHLGNQRFTCINLETGERTWTSKPYGKYSSMVAQGDRILALDQRGVLLLLKANPKEFELIDERKVSDEETWAHIAISGDEIFVRELNGLSAFRWKTVAE